MTLRYSLFGRPRNLPEITDLLVRRKAKSVDITLGEIEVGVDYHCLSHAPACEYSATTPQGVIKLSHVFLGKNNPLWVAMQMIPFIGDASLLEYKTNDEARANLETQSQDLRAQGMTVSLRDK